MEPKTVADCVAAGATFALLADFEGEDEGLIHREARVFPGVLPGWYHCLWRDHYVGALWWPKGKDR